jgi:hypothetical protein
MAEEEEVTGRAKGGIARAEALSPQVRKNIARHAAEARWQKKYPKATHDGTLNLSGNKIPCAVLEDGTRVLTEHGLTNAILGSRSGGSKRIKKVQKELGAPIPLFVAPQNLSRFISKELRDGPLNPILYQTKSGRLVYGFDAGLLPQVCEIWLNARDAGALQGQQLDKAKKAEILMRALARVGIVALVDEATGYQEIRDKLALQAILDKYLRKELAVWAKRFPDEFYRQIFRLRGWEWKGMKVNRPQVVANYTNDFVWSRITPGLLTELEARMPKSSKGRNKGRYPQLLTEDVGDPALAQHLYAVVALMTAARNWDEFKRMLNVAFPKKGANLEFNFVTEDDQ